MAPYITPVVSSQRYLRLPFQATLDLRTLLCKLVWGCLATIYPEPSLSSASIGSVPLALLDEASPFPHPTFQCHLPRPEYTITPCVLYPPTNVYSTRAPDIIVSPIELAAIQCLAGST